MDEDPFRFWRSDDDPPGRGFPHRSLAQAVGVDRLIDPDDTFYNHLPEDEQRRYRMIEQELYTDIIRGREYDQGMRLLDWMFNLLGNRDMSYILRGYWPEGQEYRFGFMGGQDGDVDPDLGDLEDAVRRLRNFVAALPREHWLREVIEDKLRRYRRGAFIGRQRDERQLAMPWSRANAGSITRFQFGRETGAVRYRPPPNFHRDYRSDRWRRW